MSTPSHLDVYEQARVTALVARPELILTPGDAADLPAQEAAGCGDLLIGYFAGEVRKLFLDGAEGDDLAALVLDRYGITVPGATAATTQVTFSRATSGAGTIAAGTRVATAVGVDGTFVTFVTRSDLVFAGATLSGTVAVDCADPGEAGNVDSAMIVRVLDTLFDTFTVTNAAAAAGGHERMTDPEIRDLARGYVKTLRKGTLAALEYGAKRVPQIRYATAVEGAIPGYVTIYVSDAFGASNAQMVTDGQSEIDSGAISGESSGWRGGGIVATVVGASVVYQAIEFTLTVRTGVDARALVDRARAAVVIAVNRLVAGEKLTLLLIKEAAKSVARDSITDVDVATPAANIAPASNQLIRTTSLLVSGS